MSVHVIQGGTTYEYPEANAWVLGDHGTLTIQQTDAGQIVNEPGVHATWEAVYDPADVKVCKELSDTPSMRAPFTCTCTPWQSCGKDCTNQR